MKSVEASPALVEDLHWTISERGDGCVIQLHGTMNAEPLPVEFSFYVEMPDGVIHADSPMAGEWVQYFDEEDLTLPE
jgi:hypothetical protein